MNSNYDSKEKNDKRASENKNESNVDEEDANNEQEEEENETSRDNDEYKDEDVSCEIAAGGNTDAPSVNICEDVLMMVKTAELRAKIEREGDYQHQLTLQKLEQANEYLKRGVRGPN